MVRHGNLAVRPCGLAPRLSGSPLGRQKAEQDKPCRRKGYPPWKDVASRAGDWKAAVKSTTPKDEGSGKADDD